MSYQVVRMIKLKASAVRGIQSHDRRERTPRSNPDVERARSADNYTLIDCDSYNYFINNRLKRLPTPQKKIRSDAVMMMQCIITSDSDFFSGLSLDQQKKFFSDSLDFISLRYGRENIVSAVVHMDEKTPHMHVNFIPIFNNEKLCAKAIFDPAEYGKLQTAYYNSVAYKYGLQRGGDKAHKRHEETNTFKNRTGYNRLKDKYLQLENRCKDLQMQIAKAETKLYNINREIDMKSKVHILTNKEMNVEGEKTSIILNNMVKRCSNIDNKIIQQLVGKCDITEDADIIEERREAVQWWQRTQQEKSQGQATIQQSMDDDDPTPRQ